MNEQEKLGLYDKSFEHDNCGIGAVVNIKGEKTHLTVNNALKIVEQLEHRASPSVFAKKMRYANPMILVRIPARVSRRVPLRIFSFTSGSPINECCNIIYDIIRNV